MLYGKSLLQNELGARGLKTFRNRKYKSLKWAAYEVISKMRLDKNNLEKERSLRPLLAIVDALNLYVKRFFKAFLVNFAAHICREVNDYL